MRQHACIPQRTQIASSAQAPEPQTMIELLRSAASLRPEKRTYTFLADGDNESISYTNAELDRRARAIAARLQERVQHGERAMILCPPGLDYVASFFGCLYAGVTAVPVYPPNPLRLKRTLPRLIKVIDDARPTVLLAPSNITMMAAEFARHAPQLGSIPWVAVDHADDGVESSWCEPAVAGNDIAFLQYTSGSTGQPKGVMISHQNLLYNLQEIKRSFNLHSESHVVTWLPPYHDMGLIGGLLQPLYCAGRVTVMSPLDFLKRPLRWLKAISSRRGTTAGGPNFAYDLCVAKTNEKTREGLDLSSWTLAFNGAEPIRAETLDRFTRTFEPYGFRPETFYPCYGLAEGTLIVSGIDHRAKPTVRQVEAEALTQNRVVDTDNEEGCRRIVGCGTSIGGQQVVIVDPEAEIPLPDRRIGEIWVQGPSVAQGFWNRPEESARVVGACLADTGDGPYLRTGDLGFLDRGELYVTGRIKDLIIISGKNYYPQDIERSIERCDPVLRPGCGVAFSLDTDGEERLVIVHEVSGDPNQLGVDRVIAAIRSTIAEEHELQVNDIVLVSHGGVEKTSSGKLQRFAARNAFLNDSLKVVASWSLVSDSTALTNDREKSDRQTEEISLANSSELELLLLRELAQRLRVQPQDIDPTLPIASFGLKSRDMVGMVGDLEVWLGRNLPATLLWEYPTVEALAGFLSSSAPSQTALVSQPDAIEDELSAILAEVEAMADDAVANEIEVIAMTA